ncbi:alpha/beta hydrolase family protein [Facklamia miroungae]|uniref:Acetyl esterase/lipase n=1 Tax=Facklamia miroungae TaxID=120956 RepID=A0A1G7V0D5_9LACT|nr:alpha/beta hydrolase [Facklamia miroungae]NKZ30213.1 alpha/beta hydrolase [Facklamia miroungae]SDG52961.1 Acetyl esterase/lipase [Facklamia miroungae]
MKQIIDIFHSSHYKISATYYKASSPENSLLIYLHGGGLIFGGREDLDQDYLELLTDNGYSILALDYLLAPENNLDEIIRILVKTLEWYQDKGYLIVGQKDPFYYLFGRSAGAYLALQLISRMSSNWIKGIISFYGYYKLNDANFLYPSPHYLNSAKVSKELIKTFIQSHPIVNGNQSERYLIYLYCRQVGSWIDFLTDSPQDFSLSKEQIKNIPPTLLVHSDKDPDVPFQQSKQINQLAKESILIKVPSTLHDFDRTDKTKGLEIYQQVIQWLSNHSAH